jgi:transposase
MLRWALFEAAKCAARASSPDHADYLQVKQRLSGNHATLAVARKLVRRCYHTLAALGGAGVRAGGRRPTSWAGGLTPCGPCARCPPR